MRHFVMHPRPLFVYSRATPQKEKGGVTWFVQDKLVKLSDGRVLYDMPVRNTTFERARMLSHALNHYRP